MTLSFYDEVEVRFVLAHGVRAEPKVLMRAGSTPSAGSLGRSRFGRKAFGRARSLRPIRR
jgi:hypothetical protein